MQINEPGYENELGTPKGETKNTGYSNIVKYCNIKFAMIDVIKNLPKGFEEVVLLHFWIKKGKILIVVSQWITEASTQEACYTELVNDHKSSWAAKFSKHDAYLTAMKQIYTELSMTLESIANLFANPFDADGLDQDLQSL
jgi:hypothetical protein